jgi:MATE family multidrug resistance protein
MLKEISKLSFPIVVGQISFALMSFIDTILMGQLGVAELAGGGLGAVVFQFFYVVGIGALVATANLIAFYKGQQNSKAVHQSLLAGVVLVLILFISFALVIWNASSILLALGQDEVTVLFSEQYLRVVVWSLLPAFGFVLMRSLVIGMGRPGAILPISLIATLLNYPLSYILMKGEFGLPEMGIKGVALGTCIIACAMFLGLVYLTYVQKEFSNYVFWKGWSDFSGARMRETWRLGFPIALAHAMEVGMFSVAALIVGLLGINALAAHQIALQSTTLSFMIPLGISQAVSVKVGECFGQNKIYDTTSALKSGLFLSSVSALLAGTFFLFAPEVLVDFFLPSENILSADYQELLVIATGILFIAALFQFVDAWQVILMGALRGFKLGRSPTLVAIFSYWCVGIPCSYFASKEWGAPGVWMGMGLGLGFCAILLGLLFQHQLKQQSKRFSM